MTAPTCTWCETIRNREPLTLCGPGRSRVYGASEAECDAFDDDAVAFNEKIAQWTTVLTNITGSAASLQATFPDCRAALEVFFCAQQQVFQVDDDGIRQPTESACSTYRRPYRTHGQCPSFCPPILDACPSAAHAYCTERCRSEAFEEYCTILEVTGLDVGQWPRSLWAEDTLDMMNLYRLEAEAGVPLLRNGRPAYRSIPARRPPGSARLTKLDYYLYATNVRGYTEWLLDTNDIDTDGAAAVVSDGNLAPYMINSDWNVWSSSRAEWAAVGVHVTCKTDAEASSSASPAGSRRSFASRGSAAAYAVPSSGALAALAASLTALRGAGARRRRGRGTPSVYDL